jgi:hypothetical protein
MPTHKKQQCWLWTQVDVLFNSYPRHNWFIINTADVIRLSWVNCILVTFQDSLHWTLAQDSTTNEYIQQIHAHPNISKRTPTPESAVSIIPYACFTYTSIICCFPKARYPVVVNRVSLWPVHAGAEIGTSSLFRWAGLCCSTCCSSGWHMQVHRKHGLKWYVTPRLH